MAMSISIGLAKKTLPDLVARAEAGEEIVITQRGKAVAKLVPIRPAAGKRRFGSLRGKISVGPEFFDPLSPEELG